MEERKNQWNLIISLDTQGECQAKVKCLKNISENCQKLMQVYKMLMEFDENLIQNLDQILLK